MAIANLTVQQPVIPRPDVSWLDGIAESLGGVIDQAGDTRLARQALGSMSAAPQQQATGGFLSRLAPQQQPQAQAPQTAAVTPVYRGDLQGDTYRPFIDTVRAGGLTNPYGLAAVASTGKAESGWSAKNAMRTWSDPSESGQPGTAGGILSWRGPRYQALAATGDLSPEGQAKFFLQENPQLIQALNNAKSVEEAQQLMNNAWAFAGYNRPGGEAGRRLAMAKSYYASEFGNAPPANGGAAAIEAIAPLEQGDTSGTETAYVDPYVKVEPRQEASVAPQGDASPYTMASPTAPQSRAPMQVADASGSTGLIAQGVTPIQRGSVDPDLIARMIGNPRLRDFGIALWKQNAGQAGGEPWQFVTLPDGTLARANQQTGAVERLGNFAKPNQDAVTVGDNLVDRATGRVIYEGKPKTPASYQEFQLARENGFTGSYADWEKVKVPGAATVTVNAGEGDKFYENLDKKNAEMFSTLSDSGMNGRSRLAQLGQLEGLLQQSPSGAEAGLKLWLGDMGINSEGLDSLQATRALVEKMVPEQRQAGSGPMSDADIVMYRRSLPSVMNQPGGNELVLGTAKAIAEYDIKMGEIADAVADRSITPSEGRKRIRELENPLSGYTEKMRKLRGTNTNGKTPPRAPAPPSAPQAPSGVDPNLWRYMTPEERKLWQ